MGRPRSGTRFAEFAFVAADHDLVEEFGVGDGFSADEALRVEH